MVAVKLGRIGLFQWCGVNGFDDCFTVVFIEAGPLQRLEVQASTLGNARPGLRVALQCAGQHCIKLQAFARKILTQAQALSLAQFTQVVVVGGSKRGLPVAYQIKCSHAQNLS